MRMLGKRNQYLFDYRIGLSADGKIQALTTEIYADGGWSLNDVDSMFAIIFGQSCYKIPTARMMPYGVRLNTPTPTAMRAPGMCNGHAMIESIMQHCAAEMSMTPSELREANLVEQGDPIMPPGRTLEDPSPIAMMIEKCKTDSDFVARRQTVDDFNSANRWKKRGLSMVPMRYDHWLRGFGLKMNALVSIFGSDGTISVTHNGIEMGQGMNTKVVQCVAQSFGVPMEMIQVKPVTTVTNPNGSTTGGSCGSESNCVATRGACEILKARLAPYKAKLGPKATWLEVIQEANASNVDLCAHYMMDVERDKYYGYQVWGVVVTEVEVDILTGEMRTVRTDLLEDAGLSTSPIVDIGQVEGAFITGLGLWTRSDKKQMCQVCLILIICSISVRRSSTILRQGSFLQCRNKIYETCNLMDFHSKISQEHLGVQATSSQGHPSGLPRHPSAQRQEPTRSALLQGEMFQFSLEIQILITGDWRACSSDGNLCSLLHLGRP